jgi:uncharacterized membrane protein
MHDLIIPLVWSLPGAIAALLFLRHECREEGHVTLGWAAVSILGGVLAGWIFAAVMAAVAITNLSVWDRKIHCRRKQSH